MGTYLTDAFGYRTCVQPNLVNEFGSTWITYKIQSANITAYSDENRKCLNEVELTYIILMAFTFTIGLVAVYVLLTRFRTEVVSLFHRKNRWYTIYDIAGKKTPDYDTALKDPKWPKKFYKQECDAYKGNYFT